MCDYLPSRSDLRSPSSSEQTLATCIDHVLFLGSNPKMFRSDAKLVVGKGKAIMEYIKSIFDFSEVEQPACYVRLYEPEMAVAADVTITRTGFCSNPDPATVRLTNLSPKSLWKRFRETIGGEYRIGMKALGFPAVVANIDLRSVHTLLCHALGCFYSARAFSLW